MQHAHQRSIHSPRQGPRQRGSTLSGVLAAIGIAGTFAAVVYVVIPSDLHGGAALSSAQPIEAEHEDNQLLLESLAALIGRSAEVIAIHPRTASPYMEIVLRLDGPDDAEEIAPEQVAVISHSSVLHTIMMYTLEDQRRVGVSNDEANTTPGDAERQQATENGQLPRSGTSSPHFTRVELSRPGFCDRWRSDPNIRARLLARGISDMTIHTFEHSNRDLSTLHLSLTWSPDSADGGDTAAVLVNAAMQAN